MSIRWRSAELTLNADKINKWLALVANVAVVAGIVFLVLELNQNSRMMQTQTRNAITESILAFQFNAETSGLRAVAQKANNDPSSLTAEEAQKVGQLYVSNLRLWENIHYQYRNGVFDEDEFNAERNSWKGLGERTPLLRGVYCQLKQAGSLSPAFVAEMDKLAYGAPDSCDTKLNLFAPREAAASQQAPVKIVATIAMQGAFAEIEDTLGARAGVPVAVEFATTAALVERLANGETADLAVLTKDAVRELAAKGQVRSSTDLVASVIGIAVADDAPLPVMRTTADFVAFMRATPSVAYTARGVSGLHMAKLVEQLGLADVVEPKAVVVDGFAGEPLRAGKVAAAVQQVSELKFMGAKNIVPLPDEIQVATTFTVAVLNGAANEDSAESVARVMMSAEAAAAYERAGSSPLFR
jgi:molybdate transport system substrate-binding protein